MKKICILLVMGMFVCSCKSELKDGDYNIELYSQHDIHGRFFDSLYVGNSEHPASVANISAFIKERRNISGKENVILIDNGDNLQGDNAAYFFNYVYDYSKDKDKRHLFSKIVDYIGYDAVIVGNHDIETGHNVYDRIKRELKVPYLAANAIDVSTNKAYFDEYTILNKNGIKVAVIGMTNPNIKKWLGEDLWKGIDFYPIKNIADSLIINIKQKENPQIIILAIHAGLGENDSTDIENPALYLASTLQGIDAVIASHDHKEYCGKVFNGVDSVLVVDGGARGNYLSGINIKLKVVGGKVIDKEIVGSIIEMKNTPKDVEYLTHFRDEFDKVKSFTNKKVGELDKDIFTKEAYFGASDYINFLHKIQLDASNADFSIVAPLTYNGIIKKGEINYNSLFVIYPFENQLYKIKLTGKQIKNYLEFSYNNWVNTVAKKGDHILKINFNPDKNKYNFTEPFFNFDALSGLDYKVDVTKPYGEKIVIKELLDGREFKENQEYTVAITSYRANGGGDLLEKGAGISPDNFDAIIVEKFQDIRTLIYNFFSAGKKLDLENISKWEFVPKSIVNEGLERDSLLLFGDK
jgi:5''-nucleotidase/2'',3''-cyclic phosphodiesterase and related esterases